MSSVDTKTETGTESVEERRKRARKNNVRGLLLLLALIAILAGTAVMTRIMYLKG